MLLVKIIRNKEIIIYGIAIAILFSLLQFLEFKFLIVDYRLEIYISAIALLFTGLGIWLALKLAAPKSIVIEKTSAPPFVQNKDEIAARRISRRELEVLDLMASGLSNQEISDRLFVSLNTIKTHSSKLFEKLEVKRRMQAVETAKKLRIIG